MESRNPRPMDFRARLALCAVALWLYAAGSATAHHTYSMFDATRRASVSGTVAKFEWKNPHAYIWIYVPSRKTAGQYELWAFENGAPTVLAAQGWTKNLLQVNDRITVDYAPLRDGSTGGHCIKVTLPDGRSLSCPGPFNVPAPGAGP